MQRHLLYSRSVTPSCARGQLSGPHQGVGLHHILPAKVLRVRHYEMGGDGGEEKLRF